MFFRKKNLTQREWVADRLLAGENLTPAVALKRFGIFRLGAIVHTLRKDGMNVLTELVENKNGGRYASYSLG